VFVAQPGHAPDASSRAVGRQRLLILIHDIISSRLRSMPMDGCYRSSSDRPARR
jgi:hypothetical protein